MRVDLIRRSHLGVQREWTNLDLDDVLLLADETGLRVRNVTANLPTFRRRGLQHLSDPLITSVWEFLSPGMAAAVLTASKRYRQPQFRKVGKILRDYPSGRWYLAAVYEQPELEAQIRKNSSSVLLLGSAQYIDDLDEEILLTQEVR